MIVGAAACAGRTVGYRWKHRGWERLTGTKIEDNGAAARCGQLGMRSPTLGDPPTQYNSPCGCSRREGGGRVWNAVSGAGHSQCVREVKKRNKKIEQGGQHVEAGSQGLQIVSQAAARAEKVVGTRTIGTRKIQGCKCGHRKTGIQCYAAKSERGESRKRQDGPFGQTGHVGARTADGLAERLGAAAAKPRPYDFPVFVSVFAGKYIVPLNHLAYFWLKSCRIKAIKLCSVQNESACYGLICYSQTREPSSPHGHKDNLTRSNKVNKLAIHNQCPNFYKCFQEQLRLSASLSSLSQFGSLVMTVWDRASQIALQRKEGVRFPPQADKEQDASSGEPCFGANALVARENTCHRQIYFHPPDPYRGPPNRHLTCQKISPKDEKEVFVNHGDLHKLASLIA
ncbi:hypothetical protein C8J57DRAFT_1225769 [Mycena rebaudengoi]|nr:hypothetical protein C8J57DRAFT_1225769 [Mycena rebaudengoi]